MLAIVRRVQCHLQNPDSPHRRIVVGFLWVSLFVFVGKLAGAAKEMTVAWRYGVSPTVDAYVFVFNLVSWPVAVWFGIISAVLVPLAARIRHDFPERMPRFRAELLGVTLLLGGVLGLATWVGLPLLLRSGWLGLSAAALGPALSMAGGLSWLVPLGILVGLFSSWLLASGHHRNTLFEAIPALVLLGVLLLPSGWVGAPLLWGTVAGVTLHVLALALPLHRSGGLPAPAFTRQSPVWPLVWSGIGAMALGQTLKSLGGLLDQFFAAGLDAGALSSLGYANRLLSLVLGLGATAVGRAVLPVFSAGEAEGGSGMQALALRWAWWMFLLGVVVAAVGWAGSPLAVRLLFERGAFSAHDTTTVAGVLRFALFQVPFYFSGMVLIYVLVTRRQYGLVTLNALIDILVKLLAASLLVRWYKLDGLVLSSAVVGGLSLVCLYGFVKLKK